MLSGVISWKNANTITIGSGIMYTQPLRIDEEQLKTYKLKRYKELKAELAELHKELKHEGLLDEQTDEFKLRGSL